MSKRLEEVRNLAEGEFVGDALRNIMYSMTDIDNISKALNDIGVSAYDANGGAKSICKILEELKDKFIDIKR